MQQIISFLGVTLVYENNNTKIGNNNIDSSFYFYGNTFEKITISNDSEKVTTIRNKNITITSLDILKDRTCGILNEYLNQIDLLIYKNVYPDWLYSYNFYDDKEQKDLIEQAKSQIKIQKEIIEKIKNIIHEKKFIVSLIGIVLLAISVNFVELLCSSGLPTVFISILSKDS